MTTLPLNPTPSVPAPAKPWDDSPLLQKLLNRGGRFALDSFRVYTLYSPLLFTGNDFEIDGQGATLKIADGVPTNTAAGDTLHLQNCNRGKIHNLTFDGNRANRPPAPQSCPATLRIQGCNDLVISDCAFVNDALDGIFVWCATVGTDVNSASKYIRVTGCTFDSPGRNGISIIHGAFVRIDHNIFRNARGLDPQCGVDIEPNPTDAPGIAHDIILESNLVENCGKGLAANVGFEMYGITFRSNDITGCDTGLFNAASGASILGNVVSGSKSLDINVSNADRCSLLNNVAGSIYADTYSIPSPVGHTLIGNVGEVNVKYAGGNTVVK